MSLPDGIHFENNEYFWTYYKKVSIVPYSACFLVLEVLWVLLEPTRRIPVLPAVTLVSAFFIYGVWAMNDLVAGAPRVYLLTDTEIRMFIPEEYRRKLSRMLIMQNAASFFNNTDRPGNTVLPADTSVSYADITHVTVSDDITLHSAGKSLSVHTCSEAQKTWFTGFLRDRRPDLHLQ